MHMGKEMMREKAQRGNKWWEREGRWLGSLSERMIKVRRLNTFRKILE